ncbi:MAG: sigma-70 family RNA polymerase sigma factor [Planctomycetota bacterium]|nr:sigma-70 family RNA polymerase sigma factor [Planctomycetota bacterium]MEC9157882.1 sigma-70 family RNA polymerase sigma factor [Planctomycetota bacterium]MED5506831.1 sigma-70 family RNA polymerase sigma factor [Planctomycetota bacterium]
MELTRTTTALLEGLRDSENAILWEAFDRRYRPILVGFARNLGLDEVDAADVAQETLSRFVQEYREGRYDRSRGRLGAWLVGIARYRILDLRRKRAGSRQVAEPEALASLDDEQHLSRIWDQERRQALLQEAMGELREHSRTDPRTIEIFELLMVHGLSTQAVAEQMGVSDHDVYLAKSRVAQRLRKIIERLEAEYDDGA